jgi:hypothetical protein
MLVAMRSLPLSRVVLVSVVLTLAAALAGAFGGGAGCGTNYIWDCAGPDGGNIGSDNSGDLVCPCGSGCCIYGPVQAGPYPVGNCPWFDAGADGGALVCGPGTVRVGNECVPAGDDGDGGDDGGDGGDGGPLPACTGQCVPLPPPEWTPVLLWSGAQASAPSCPDLGLTVVFDGVAIANDASSTFGLACTSNASGACPGPLDVCGPAPAVGFLPCVMHDGDLPCASQGPYPEWYLFYEGTAPEPSLPSTFCCAPSPRIPP